MRIDLGQLAIQDLDLALPAAPSDSRPNNVTVQSAEALRGVFSSGEGDWALEGLTAVRVVLAKLHWKFGALSLGTEQSATLSALKVDASSGETVDLTVELAQLEALDLHVAVGALELTAKLDAHALRLETREGVGRLVAEHAVFRSFALRTGTVQVALPELVVTQLLLDWGGDDFRLEAGTAEAHELTLSQGESTLRGSGLSVAAVRLLGTQVQVGQLRMARLDLAAGLAPSKQPTSEDERRETPSKPGPVFDYALLDGLAGRLDVDVAVDLAVPIIGRRRATHELRVPINDGAINYRELESNLARLEDSLIDFSVRDGALVLERGLPLIATRGRGKPILLWDLTPEELALAEQQRVRLAVLPNFRMAAPSGQSEPPREKDDNGGGLKLRHLSFENIDAALRLPHNPVPPRGVLGDLTFANLTLHGVVHHDPEGPERGGALHAALEGLRTSLRALAIGTQTLSGRLEIAALHDMQVEFQDIKPSRVTAVAEGIALADLALV
jgi:hypothetical protein